VGATAAPLVRGMHARDDAAFVAVAVRAGEGDLAVLRRSASVSFGRTADPCAARLMRMVAALEESIIRLELETDGAATSSIRRLRVLQGEILAALHLLEGDFPGSA